jgi:microcystin-dependent protein
VGLIDSEDSNVLKKLTWANLKAVLTPIGVVDIFAGDSAPTGFLLCNGASLNRVGTYAALFAVIGTTYGTVDANTFNVPNIKGRSIVGVDAAQAEFDVLGETGGAKTVSVAHTHTGPSHQHTATTSGIAAFTGSFLLGTGATNADHTHNVTTSSGGTGATGAMSANATPSVLSPYISMNYIIRF